MAASGHEQPSTREQRWALHNGLHLAAFWALAVLQPTLDVLSQGPDLFIARKVDGGAFVGACVVFALLPPAILLGVELVANRLAPRIRKVVHALFIWGLLTLFALFLLKQYFPTGGSVLFLGAVLVGSAAAVAYVRLPEVRSFSDFLAPAPLVCLVLFLFFSSSSGLIFPKADAAGSERTALRTPIVWLVFDELPISSLMNPGERVDTARFPNFGRLANQSLWFRNVAASGDETQEAIPPILSGDRPITGHLPTFTDHPDNLFTFFAASHAVNAMEHETWLCPGTICPPEFGSVRRMYDVVSAMGIVYAHVVAPAEYQSRIPIVGRTLGEALTSEDPRTEIDPSTTSNAELAKRGGPQFERFLEEINPQPRGQKAPLYFLHSSLPHTPWIYSPLGRQYAEMDNVPPGLRDLHGALGVAALGKWTKDRSTVQGGHQRHLLQVKYVDRLLGQLIEKLKRQGLYDRAMLVVTADHGVSFLPGGTRREVRRRNIGDIELVPFFVKLPGQRKGRVIDTRLQTIDELPTVADLLKTKLTWDTDGVAASAMSREGRRRITVLRHNDETEVSFPYAALLRQRAQTVDRNARLFGTGELGPSFYGIGPFHELAGRSVSPSRPAAEPQARLALDHADDYEDIDLSSPYIPALVTGQVVGAAPTRVSDVAISVNGKVVAVAPTFENEGVRFSVMVPESSFRPGANRVRVNGISRTGRAGSGALQLFRLTQEP